MMAEPVRVRINRKRCVGLGALQTFMGLIVLAMVGIPMVFGIFDWLIAAGLAAAGFFLWFGFFFFALARRNPVALRMDEKGVSGYYADPATWGEIKDVHAFKGPRGHEFLGFELHDPVGFRDRQTPWRRYLSWTNGRTNRAHLTVPQMVLHDAKVEELAKIASELRAQYSSQGQKPFDLRVDDRHVPHDEVT